MKHPKEPEARPDSPLQVRAEKDAQFAEDMWRFRNPEEDGKKFTLAEILVEVPLRYGIVVNSLDTLSRFYRWLKVRRDFQAKRDAIAQFKQELAKDPEVSEEQIERAGRVMFLTDSMVEKDPKVFASMVRIGQDNKTLEQRNRQIAQKDAEIAQKDELLKQAERKLAILEKKAAMADAAEAIESDENLTEEEKTARMRQLFRMG